METEEGKTLEPFTPMQTDTIRSHTKSRMGCLTWCVGPEDFDVSQTY